MTDLNSRKSYWAFCVALLLLLLSSALWSQDSSAPSQVPPQLKPPTDAKLILHARGKGDQVYVCKQDGSQFSWSLKEPQAELLDESGKVIGRHFAGPSWQLNDRSQVSGKVIARIDSPNADAVPWLLLGAGDHSGTGLMSGVSYIQRLNTSGGKAPNAGCDAAHAGAESRISYSADYYFFGK